MNKTYKSASTNAVADEFRRLNARITDLEAKVEDKITIIVDLEDQLQSAVDREEYLERAIDDLEKKLSTNQPTKRL